MSQQEQPTGPESPYLLVGLGIIAGALAVVVHTMNDGPPAWAGWLLLLLASVLLSVGTVAAGVEYGLSRHAHKHGK